MDVFWNTIAAYNAATWPVQLLLVAVAAVLTLLLYLRPTRAVRMAMKVFMAALNFWIAGVYYFLYCAPREHYDILALFWTVMGCIWIYDLAAGHDSLGRTGRHSQFALALFCMPLVYPLFSLALGRTFPMMTSPVMPCSVAVFTVALMLAFSERANIVLATFLCHWALIGLSKVYFFRDSRGFSAGVQRRTRSLPLFPALYPESGLRIHQTLPACAECIACRPVCRHRGFLHFYASASIRSLYRNMIPYRAEDFSVTVSVADYIARFRDAERFEGCCRACPNYGCSWGCPPFDFDVEEYLNRYSRALLIATKIAPEQRDLPIAEAKRLIHPERQRLERRLLEMERRYGGRSFAYVGSCLYCPEGTCTRPEGNPCRHPELVRPSLEACGFDIGRTTSELFGIELKWGADGKMPEYLTLVCGFFHDGDGVVW